MKYALKAFNNRLALATVMALLATADSYAAINNTNIGSIFKDDKFTTAVTIGFGIFAFFKWVEYFADFNPGSALKSIILPAVLTFLTFQWDKVLKWIGLM